MARRARDRRPFCRPRRRDRRERAWAREPRCSRARELEPGASGTRRAHRASRRTSSSASSSASGCRWAARRRASAGRASRSRTSTASAACSSARSSAIHVVDDRGRLVPAVLVRQPRRAVHVELPAALDGARDRRRRDPPRARDHEPLPQAAPVLVLAEGALRELRGVDARLAARRDVGHRPRRLVARDHLRREHRVACVALLVWRFAREPLRSPGVALAGGVSVVAVPLLIVGPLYHSAPPWDAKNVSETLTGRVIRNGTNLTQIVSFVGQAQAAAEARSSAPTSSSRGRASRTRRSSSSTCRAGTSAAARSRMSAGRDFSGTCRMRERRDPHGRRELVGQRRRRQRDRSDSAEWLGDSSHSPRSRSLVAGCGSAAATPPATTTAPRDAEADRLATATDLEGVRRRPAARKGADHRRSRREQLDRHDPRRRRRARCASSGICPSRRTTQPLWLSADRSISSAAGRPSPSRRSCGSTRRMERRQTSGRSANLFPTSAQ